jgi:hypothetical protein
MEKCRKQTMGRSMKMKVGFITTIDTNIGDDFIREGIINALKYTFPDTEFDFVLVNKHLPHTAYPVFHPMRYLHKLNGIRGGRRIQKVVKKVIGGRGSKYENCDVIIQSGAPVLWPNCAANEWNVPIWQEIVGRLHKKIPVLNLAAGSCYPMEAIPETISSEKDAAYLRSIFSYCKLTTTRDPLAEKLFGSLGCSPAPMLPCSAFLVSNNYPSTNGEDKYVLINYMEGGGHFDWSQKIDKKEWENTVLEIIRSLRNHHKVAFLCHNEKEESLARQLAPDLPSFYPKTVQEYIQVISNAKTALNNRMHASVAMASLGIPSIAVCTDTRLLMVKNVGASTIYVKDARPEQIVQQLNDYINNAEVERDRFFALKRDTFDRYAALLRKNI